MLNPEGIGISDNRNRSEKKLSISMTEAKIKRNR